MDFEEYLENAVKRGLENVGSMDSEMMVTVILKAISNGNQGLCEVVFDNGLIVRTFGDEGGLQFHPVGSIGGFMTALTFGNKINLKDGVTKTIVFRGYSGDTYEYDADELIGTKGDE